MTGAYLRTKRDNRWENIEVDQLTDAELDELERSQGAERGWVWAKFLAKWIRENVKEQDGSDRDRDVLKLISLEPIGTLAIPENDPNPECKHQHVMHPDQRGRMLFAEGGGGGLDNPSTAQRP